MFQHNKLKNKDIDLLRAFQEKKEPSKYASILKYAIFPVVASVLILSIFGYKTYSNYQVARDIKATDAESARIQKEIDNNPNLERYNAYLETQKKTMKYELQYGNIQSYPQLSQGTFDSILMASSLRVKVTTFSYVRESQVISLGIEATSANDTELFVRRLKDTGIFDAVKYTGYNRVNKVVETQPTTTPEADTTTNQNTQEALLQALLNATNKTSEQEKQNTETTTAYTATVLCTLKK